MREKTEENELSHSAWEWTCQRLKCTVQTSWRIGGKLLHADLKERNRTDSAVLVKQDRKKRYEHAWKESTNLRGSFNNMHRRMSEIRLYSLGSPH